MAKTGNYRCNECDPEFMTRTADQLVDHYANKHPDSPESLYAAIGRTWNPAFDRLIQRVEKKERERHDLETALKSLRAEHDKLIGRHNAIIGRVNASLILLSSDIDKR